MKKRILGEDGKFRDFKGTRVLKKIKTSAAKEMERKKVEALADRHGIDVEGGEDGGLSENDKILIRSGELTLQALLGLATLRGIALPKGLSSKEEVSNAILKEVKEVKPVTETETVTETITAGPTFTSEEQEALEKGMSIPEMKELAKKYKIAFGAKIKKDELRALLLGEDVISTENTDGSGEDEL